MEQKGHKGKANYTGKIQVAGKWDVTTDDNSTGSVLDTARPMNGPYDRQIGPQSKTKFGLNRKA